MRYDWGSAHGLLLSWDSVDNQCISSSALSQHRLKSAASSPAAKLRDYCAPWLLWFSVVPGVASPFLAQIDDVNFRNREAPRYQRRSGEPATSRPSPTRGLADICKTLEGQGCWGCQACRSFCTIQGPLYHHLQHPYPAGTGSPPHPRLHICTTSGPARPPASRSPPLPPFPQTG